MERTAEEFFFGKPERLALYKAAEKTVLGTFPNVQVDVQKTQITFRAKRGFACVSFKQMKGMPPVYVILSFWLAHRIESKRIWLVADSRPSRYTHHFILHDPAQLDSEVVGWLKEAYDFSMR